MFLGDLKKYDMFIHHGGMYAVTQDRYKSEGGPPEKGTKGVRLMAVNIDGEWVAEISSRVTVEMLDSIEVSRVVHIN